ncbi:hypothetical protein KC318_g777 [Hortaea werneckii]|nr:hypothetical protein KC334_g7816 [Hortaea werneckii]KAI7025683.1 hypothetical protein KC355_g925 [Hortaea werneckii]KAI7195327.1 hypothetical protein KC324_g4708 [Hortaea werneckii]KAI7575733.1 hypothetical protein KC316_g10961 [Hortaea werneckii]KAI7675704.1 hypothetical protein KC318_g777 [Hortaea werneckii]
MSGTPEAPTSFHSNANPLDRVDSAKYLSEQLESPISELVERFHGTHLDPIPLHTTLGIELEFVLAHVTPAPQVHRGSPSGGLLGLRVVRHMLQQPVTVRCATCNKKHKTKLTVNLDEDDDENYTGWTVTEDDSIRTKEETTHLKNKQGHVRFYKIEVVSRVLSAEMNRDTRQSRDQPEHTHSITFSEEISAVLAIINGMSESTVKDISGRFYPFVNGSCGLHVHVGNQQDGFPLQTVKNFLTVFALCERQIDMLNSVQRIGGSDLPTQPVKDRFIYLHPTSGLAEFGLWDESVYNLPLSAWHHIGVHHRLHCLQAGYETLDPVAAYTLYMSGQCGKGKFYSVEDVDLLDQDVDLLDRVRTGRYPENMFAESTDLEKAAHQYSAGANVVVIQNAPTVLALNSLMANAHESSINIANIYVFPWDGESPDKKMTIELRQHAGTLDVQQVLSWVDFVISAMRYSHVKQSYEQMANTRFSDPEYDAIDLLAELGCHEHTVQHYTAQLHGNDCGELYADSKKAAASKIVSELSTTEEGKIIAPVLTRSIEQQTTAFHPDHVSRRICEKLLVGAYGHFSDEHLDKLFSRIIPKPADEAKERLRLGQGLRGALPEDSVDMVQNEQLDCRRTQMQTHQDNTNPRTHVLDNEQNDPVQEQHPTKTSASGRPNAASSKDGVASFLETRSRNNSAKTSSTEDHTVDDSDEDPSAQILESVKQILPSPGKEYPEKVTGDWAELELTMEESVRRDSETSVLTFEF